MNRLSSKDFFDHSAGLDKVLIHLGLIKRQGPAYWLLILGLDAVLLLWGIILVQRAEKHPA